MSDETTLRECPFCGGEARLVNDYSIEKGMRYQIWHECTGHEGRSGGYGQGVKPFFETPWYPTDAEAIAAWNTRAAKPCYATDHTHDGCKYSVNRGWVENVAHGTLTAEQVREAIERHVKFYEGGDYDEQVIADELNAKLGSGTCHSTTDSSAWCFVCSECGKSFPRNKLHLAHNHGEINYCPNCGKRVER